jgi:peptide/nickel transport system ATP-binding protein
MAETLVKIRDLRKHYPVETGLLARLRGNQRYVHAVDGIDLDIQRGEIIGIAGESGCGKTTAARCLTLLEDPSGGEIRFLHDGVDADIGTFGKRERKEYREDVQLIYQDPYESINDRFTIRKWVREPLQVHGIGSREEQETKVVDVLGECGLSPPKEYLDQFPHELSGGMTQRALIALSLVLEPSFIVADEPTSMLDVSVRAGLLRLFNRLVQEQNITLLYISHDLSLLRYVCDRIAVMYRGKIAEKGPSQQVLNDPKHPYTEALVSAVPRVNPGVSREHVTIPGEVEENIGGSEGCVFKDRCPYRFDKCEETPGYFAVGDGDHQQVACHLYDESIEHDQGTVGDD